MDLQKENISVNDETMEQVSGGAHVVGGYRICPVCKINKPFNEFLNYQGKLICAPCLKKIGVNSQTPDAAKQGG